LLKSGWINGLNRAIKSGGPWPFRTTVISFTQHKKRML
jgi:hypothetical protein